MNNTRIKSKKNNIEKESDPVCEEAMTMKGNMDKLQGEVRVLQEDMGMVKDYLQRIEEGLRMCEI